jgi:hypothetical protein
VKVKSKDSLASVKIEHAGGTHSFQIGKDPQVDVIHDRDGLVTVKVKIVDESKTVSHFAWAMTAGVAARLKNRL